ncbi:heme-binding protein [Lentisphaera profundi]|uniref:Heme-binding protein n=1 Tax=Lentisphaera profundi TaxID=1658616 RepID=A0ABY7VMQ9_9BACT|nr:heme-binding protein [Lentisphaera profundi]WDE95315.1 heme-binding protein [Lentisphaera profundi]
MKKYFTLILSLILLTQLSASLMGGSQLANIVDTAQSAKQFKILIAALKQADLAEVLNKPGPFTVLAPNDEAFGKLPLGTVESLLQEDNRDKLIAILKAHVISGSLDARQLVASQSLINLQGQSMPVTFNKGQLNISGVNLIATDIKASNGVIHILDTVILPTVELSNSLKMRQLIEFSIAQGVPLFNKGELQACAAIYELCAQSLSHFNSDDISKNLATELTQTLEKVSRSDDARSNAWLLRSSLDKVYAELTNPIHQSSKPIKKSQYEFKVILEADLPRGFPAPGPLNKLIVKQYPAYRSAKLQSSKGQSLSFMKLFGHIKNNKISMTAPVEMQIDKTTGQRQSMAFLYGDKNIGTAGLLNSGVAVVDEVAQDYVSIGLSGRESSELIKDAIAQIDAWLLENPSYTSAGEVRLLAYNSPMIPASKRFWEVQLPIKKQ